MTEKTTPTGQHEYDCHYHTHGEGCDCALSRKPVPKWQCQECGEEYTLTSPFPSRVLPRLAPTEEVAAACDCAHCYDTAIEVAEIYASDFARGKAEGGIPAPVMWALRLIGMPEWASTPETMSRWISEIPAQWKAVAKAEGAKEEREAVVRFTNVAKGAKGQFLDLRTVHRLIELIERGDHLKGER